MAAGATVACEDLSFPGATVATDDLVVLAQAADAPAPGTASFWVTNAATRVRSLRHPDAFNTLYLELRFPAGSLDQLDGQPLGADDSVLVTVEPLAGGYGFSLSPDGLTFAAGAQPAALFAFGRYGDASVADGEPSFPDREAYLAALEVWRDVGLDAWSVARGSSAAGVDAMSASLDAAGRYWLAAAR